ncbi:hypothetical protein F0L74_11745 [Chitinophaga agrisoli]|uniref:RHS repeat-associated protein n=1 Tax=Chitinophaga agrisoli TaxID=2607653 RepID=A0A5B2VVA3_9BACT|nr:hypothetical protein F0L74_11745 [Chitinophaga agrisoli]
MKGEGNQQDYGMRVYDPRVGRFLSVDPLSKNYPWNSTYAFAENDVLRNIDLDGAEKLPCFEAFPNSGKRTVLDYINAANNAGIAFLNLIPNTWNGIEASAESAWKGEYLKDLKKEWNVVGPSLWNGAVGLIRDPVSAVSSPEAVTFAFTIYMGSGEWNFKPITSNASEIARLSGIREASISKNGTGFNSIGRGRNIAYMEGIVEGEPFYEFAVSGENMSQGVQLSLDGSRSFRNFRVNNVRTNGWDSEVKLFEHFTKKFGPDPVKGKLKLVTERTMCPGCRLNLEQFRTKFPDLELEIKELSPINLYKNGTADGDFSNFFNDFKGAKATGN